jgi:uroporphyrinogen decarboxylase
MRQKIPSSIALQGNLDPDILYAPCTIIKKEVKRIVDGMKGNPGYIFNLGHGIFPDVSVDAVKILVECVKNG